MHIASGCTKWERVKEKTKEEPRHVVQIEEQRDEDWWSEFKANRGFETLEHQHSGHGLQVKPDPRMGILDDALCSHPEALWEKLSLVYNSYQLQFGEVLSKTAFDEHKKGLSPVIRCFHDDDVLSLQNALQTKTVPLFQEEQGDSIFYRPVFALSYKHDVTISRDLSNDRRRMSIDRLRAYCRLASQIATGMGFGTFRLWIDQIYSIHRNKGERWSIACCLPFAMLPVLYIQHDFADRRRLWLYAESSLAYLGPGLFSISRDMLGVTNSVKTLHVGSVCMARRPSTAPKPLFILARTILQGRLDSFEMSNPQDLVSLKSWAVGLIGICGCERGLEMNPVDGAQLFAPKSPCAKARLLFLSLGRDMPLIQANVPMPMITDFRFLNPLGWDGCSFFPGIPSSPHLDNTSELMRLMEMTDFLVYTSVEGTDDMLAIGRVLSEFGVPAFFFTLRIVGRQHLRDADWRVGVVAGMAIYHESGYSERTNRTLLRSCTLALHVTK